MMLSTTTKRESECSKQTNKDGLLRGPTHTYKVPLLREEKMKGKEQLNIHSKN